MKTSTLSLVLLLWVFAVASCNKATDTNTYLKKVLTGLEQIQSATYYESGAPYQHGDTVPLFVNHNFIKEYHNPADTTIGAVFVSLDANDTTKLNYAYDGKVMSRTNHKEKKISIDDFTHRPLSYRPITPPFFNYTKNIINYALTTRDSIDTNLQELQDDYYFKLIIHENEQIEFFGKAHRMESMNNQIDPTSTYEIWIRKSDNLPYKVRREMIHGISVRTYTDLKLNTLSIHDFDVSDYFPADYTLVKYGQNHKINTAAKLIGHKAPQWTLTDMNEQPVSFSDSKSKVLLVYFTGIGCGPCQKSIPFMKKLKDTYNTTDFDIHAIETWVRKPNALRIYADKNKLNYPLLGATDEVIDLYQTGGSAPCFFIMDEQRIVQHIFTGYGEGSADKIKNSIAALLK